MKQSYTPEQIIQFIYGETEALEKMEIEHALAEDRELNRLYFDLYNSFQLLPKIKFYPSRKAIKNILEYSSSTASPAF